MLTSPEDVLLRAYDVVESALAADGQVAAAATVRADLGVLTREELLRVAVALAVEVPRVLVPASVRARLLARLEQRRVRVIVGELDA